MPKPSNTKAFIYLLTWAIAFALGAFLPWYVGGVILGVVFWHSFVVLHACGHQAFFRNRLLNHLTARAMSLFCTLPFGMWRHLHQQHHYWSGWIDLDPTLELSQQKRSPYLEGVMNLCWKYWIPIFSISYIASTFWNPIKLSHLKGPQRLEAVLDAIFIMLVLGTFFLMADKDQILHWSLAYLSFLSLADLSVLCQHIHLPHEVSKGHKVRPFTHNEQERFAREVRAPYWIELWVFGHFNRHASHHIWPRLAPYDVKAITGKRLHEASAWQWLWEAKRMKVVDLLQEDTLERR